MIYELSDVPADRRIDTRRTIPFTPSQVFRAFADAEVLASWWGPEGFSSSFEEFDFTEGGTWRFRMHSPDGKSFANESRFVRLSEPSLVVLDHVCAPRFQAQFALGEASGGCDLHWCMIFQDAQTCRNVAKCAGNANEENVDRLVAALTRIST